MKDKVKSVGYANCFISELTIAELFYGLEKSENYKRQASDITKIEKVFTTLLIYDCFGRYAKEKFRLQKLGMLIPDFDLLIGVTSVVNSLTMVTGNEKHFNRIDAIKIENWRHPKHNKFVD